MEDMSSMKNSHNKKVINKYVKESKSCNCRVKSECPLNGQCQVTDIIYKCTALSPDKPNKVYPGTAEGDLKSDFIIIGSRLTMKVAQTIPPFQNIYMGTIRNIKFKPNSIMVFCQKVRAKNWAWG